jgi:hypothetical protein
MSAYLDAIFGGLQRFAEQRKTSQRWTACALGTSDRAWRLTFLHEARAAQSAARRLLANATAELGPPPPGIPDDADAATLPPLVVLARRLCTLRDELELEDRRLSSLEAECASREGPRWTA